MRLALGFIPAFCLGAVVRNCARAGDEVSREFRVRPQNGEDSSLCIFRILSILFILSNLFTLAAWS
jgi:hypothetical protein